MDFTGLLALGQWKNYLFPLRAPEKASGQCERSQSQCKKSFDCAQDESALPANQPVVHED
jgi:hypothetical protein